MQSRPAWRIWLLLPLGVALQTTLLAVWRPLGASVNLLLLLSVSVALLLGWEVGALFGLLAGVLTGYFAMFHLGSYAFSRMVVGGLLGCCDRRFATDSPLAAPLAAVAAVFVSNLLFWLMAPTDFAALWWVRETLAGMVVQAVAILPVHWLMVNHILPPARLMFAARQ